jgi:hypothetical protein
MHAGTCARSPRRLIEAAVLVAGARQPLYARSHDGALFAAGNPGAVYGLRVTNLTSGRIEVITTVDGRDTLKDEPGDPRANGGFVIGAYGSYDFTGFRLDDGAVREFKFGSPDRTDRTVAARASGSTANIGIFGFAAYTEYHRPHYYGNSCLNVAMAAAGPVTFGSAPLTRSGGLNSTMSAANSASAPAGSIGTEMGEWHEDRVNRTTFTRAGDPDILVIRYDTPQVLEALGILAPPGPDAFPGAGTGYEKYAQPA